MLLASDYKNRKMYQIIMRSGQIYDNSITILNDLDQEVQGIKLVSIEFNPVSESCVATVTHDNGKIQILGIIGIEDD